MGLNLIIWIGGCYLHGGEVSRLAFFGRVPIPEPKRMFYLAEILAATKCTHQITLHGAIPRKQTKYQNKDDK